MRRSLTTALSFGLLLSLAGAPHLFGQTEEKKEEAPKTAAPKAEASKAETTTTEAPKAETTKATPVAETPPPIPKEVEEKLEAARRAVAEAIVAAQDAGLVKTTIDPPPILDILITGRANDETTLKAKTGVSPEVFGAWFTGFGTTKDINPQKDVRITRPDGGLKEFYNQRDAILNRHIDAVRKSQPNAAKEPEKSGAAKEEKKEPTKDADAKKDVPPANTPKEEAKKDDNNAAESKDESPKS